MTTLLILVAVAAATVTSCELPPGTLPTTINEGFAIQVQNPDFPIIHNRLMNLWEAGGGDKHLYLAPAGNSSDSLTLVDGVITLATVVPTIRAVINGEVHFSVRLAS